MRTNYLLNLGADGEWSIERHSMRAALLLYCEPHLLITKTNIVAISFEVQEGQLTMLAAKILSR